jgi:hypothetical protein
MDSFLVKSSLRRMSTFQVHDRINDDKASLVYEHQKLTSSAIAFSESLKYGGNFSPDVFIIYPTVLLMASISGR